MQLGINLFDLVYTSGTQPFNNLIRGHSNQYIPAAFSGPLADLPSANMTNGWASSLPNSGAYITRNLSYPQSTGAHNVTWSGNITDLYLKSGPATLSSVDYVNRTATLNVTALHPTDSTVICLAYTFTDTVNYPQNISVVKSVATGTFNSRFLTDIARFNGFRAIKWLSAAIEVQGGNQTAWAGGTQASPTRTYLWANRNTTTGGDWINYDGVPIELIVELANTVKTLNPSFNWIHLNIPWNADDAWINGVAAYVRDNLNTSITCRFECANEVWNPFYPVEKQSWNEAVSAGLPNLGFGEAGYARVRYAQRRHEMMSLITTVFSGQLSRIKRMYCDQHANSGMTRATLDWMAANNPSWLTTIDMLATAPYFAPDDSGTYNGTAYNLSYAGTDYTGLFNSVDWYIDTFLTGDMTTHVATAAAYSLPLTTYESGPSFRFNSQTVQDVVHRDSRMAQKCTKALNWMNQYYSTANWFAICSPIGAPEAWGLKEYEAQTINSTNTPKFQAVIDFMAGA